MVQSFIKNALDEVIAPSRSAEAFDATQAGQAAWQAPDSSDTPP
jgi:hypothetical protein